MLRMQQRLNNIAAARPVTYAALEQLIERADARILREDAERDNGSVRAR
jgi:hypothetical protein